jgi:cadmium resistance protein CadD (predicted permease)
MTNILILVAITVISFIGTNFENLLLVIVFLSDSAQSKSSVALGYLVGMAIIVGSARILSSVSDFVPSQFLELLGLIPLSLGIWELMQVLRYRIPRSVPHVSFTSGTRSVVAISIITIANGADSLAALTALFVETQWYLKWLIWVTTLGMTFIWFSLAVWLVRLQFFSLSRQRFIQILMPFFLIGLGIYILADSPTDLEVYPPL